MREARPSIDACSGIEYTKIEGKKSTSPVEEIIYICLFGLLPKFKLKAKVFSISR